MAEYPISPGPEPSRSPESLRQARLRRWPWPEGVLGMLVALLGAMLLVGGIALTARGRSW